MLIAAGQSAQFDYPGPNERWTLHISIGRCEIEYVVPSSLEHVPTRPYDVPLKAQLERDLSIFLLPAEAKTITDVGSLRSLQVEGFPLEAKSRTCR